ncbi:uncharacterized protein CLUP02_17066 [Colletotrichum lupini]|uniref:Uncharacterized protein n=1 Tax=Colletotrichum lupini TaxID=145971 RepID=A0A9Q8T9I2_9PEZI|nr:uncharacterized protein CLUP02_17066 [Colletotrichum lupini]UQC91530.1 hypothetical protein CLUP02_17066 [Colletotrichum lupini]
MSRSNQLLGVRYPPRPGTGLQVVYPGPHQDACRSSCSASDVGGIVYPETRYKKAFLIIAKEGMEECKANERTISSVHLQALRFTRRTPEPADGVTRWLRVRESQQFRRSRILPLPVFAQILFPLGVLAHVPYTYGGGWGDTGGLSTASLSLFRYPAFDSIGMPICWAPAVCLRGRRPTHLRVQPTMNPAWHFAFSFSVTLARSMSVLPCLGLSDVALLCLASHPRPTRYTRLSRAHHHLYHLPNHNHYGQTRGPRLRRGLAGLRTQFSNKLHQLSTLTNHHQQHQHQQISRQHARRSLLLQVRKHDRHQQLVPVLRPPRDESKSLPARRCLHSTERDYEAQSEKGKPYTTRTHINQAGKWPPPLPPKPMNSELSSTRHLKLFYHNLAALRVQRKFFGATSANDLHGHPVDGGFRRRNIRSRGYHFLPPASVHKGTCLCSLGLPAPSSVQRTVTARRDDAGKSGSHTAVLAPGLGLRKSPPTRNHGPQRPTPIVEPRGTLPLPASSLVLATSSLRASCESLNGGVRSMHGAFPRLINVHVPMYRRLAEVLVNTT